MVTMYTESVADKIIEYWQPRLIGQTITAFGKDYPVTHLYKDGANDKYRVMVGTCSPNNDAIKVFLYSIGWLEDIDKFDWERGEEKH